MSTKTDVMPISGCNTNINTKIAAIPVAHIQPGNSSPSRQRVRSHAQVMAKKGFANSDGCILNGPKENHLVAPLISLPINASPVKVVIPLNVANEDVSATETTVASAVIACVV